MKYQVRIGSEFEVFDSETASATNVVTIVIDNKGVPEGEKKPVWKSVFWGLFVLVSVLALPSLAYGFFTHDYAELRKFGELINEILKACLSILSDFKK